LPLDGDTIQQTTGKAADLQDGDGGYRAGVIGQALELDGQTHLAVGDLGNFGFYDKFTLAAWACVSERGGGTIVSRMIDTPQGEGYQLAITEGKLQLNLVKRWLDDATRVETSAAITPGLWHHVAATYDGSREAEGIKLYVDGQPQALTVLLDELNQSFATKQPLRIGAGGGPESRFRGAIDELRVYQGALAADEVQILATPQSISTILATAPEKRVDGQRLKLRTHFLTQDASPAIHAAWCQRLASARDLAALRESLPTVMVMEEMPTPRQTHLLLRGQYDKPGERVEPGVPAELPPLPAGASANRLGLARWLADPANPLTSRVIVNRVWQLHFGAGIVKTSEDFGRQGEWPTHPELLDWLGAELIRSGWDLKRLHREIVTSATFRQSSRVPNELFARDPDNRLLARAPRLRLTAEMVRDQALLASGLLVEQLGGPSVRPLQPAGLWSELTGGDDYQPGIGAELVRRSLYTFWKRTIPPPLLATFDAPTRESCTVRESRTNTPLQALALLNEPTYEAASRGLAERISREAATPDERIALAMLLVVGRRPAVQEQAVLRAAWERYRRRFAAMPQEAEKLLAGGTSPPSAVPLTELAAYTLVCNTILNLDEAVTRQ
jgi:Protein of unknown function (DUF1553)/Concanavalin A-like lectin/glucanases superfamily